MRFLMFDQPAEHLVDVPQLIVEFGPILPAEISDPLRNLQLSINFAK